MVQQERGRYRLVFGLVLIGALLIMNGLPSTSVEHLSRTASDHAPLLIQITSKVMLGIKPWRFQRMWTCHDQFLQLVSAVWFLLGAPAFVVSGKLTNL